MFGSKVKVRAAGSWRVLGPGRPWSAVDPRGWMLCSAVRRAPVASRHAALERLESESLHRHVTRSLPMGSHRPDPLPPRLPVR